MIPPCHSYYLHSSIPRDIKFGQGVSDQTTCCWHLDGFKPDFIQQICLFSSVRGGIEECANTLNLGRRSKHEEDIARKQFAVWTWTRQRIALPLDTYH